VLVSLRAELLVLRKSKVAWALVLTAPLLTLVTTYLFQFLDYVGETPAMYASRGTPAQALPALLPSQFVIQAIGSIGSTAPFIVLGAVIAGGDWGRGTITTSLLQRPGRARTFAGQALAIMIACALSVVLCFALAALASAAIRWYAGPTAPGAVGNVAFPAWSVTGEGVGAGLLIGLAYGTLGIALGTLCRSAAGGVAAALAWYVLVEDVLYDLSLNAGGEFEHLYNAFPGASVITLTSMFGSPGGGASSATYQPVSPWAATAILVGYTAAFLSVALILVRRRDVVTASRAWFTRPRDIRPRDIRPGALAGSQRTGPPTVQDSGRGAGVLATARAELLVMRKWPAMWVFVLIPAAITLIDGYVLPYVLYRAGSSAVISSTPALVLAKILPGQYVPSALNSIGYDPTLPGTAAFFLIGALAAGSTWSGGTIRTSLLQAPTRIRTAAGQALAITIALVISVVLTFAVTGLSSILIAVTATGSVSPATSPLPGPGRLIAGVGIAVIVSLAWGAVGWTAGTLLRNAAGAFAAILLWTTIVQLQLDQFAPEMPGPVHAVYDLLPDAATSTVTNLFGQAGYFGGQLILGEVALPAAFATLAAYALACLALPVIMTRRRDIP
jgi:ABC-2 type transport system permease protein